MKTVRYLIRNANVLNMVLFAVAVALIAGITLPLARMRYAYSPPRIKPKAPVEEAPSEFTGGRLPSDYAIIGENNLFHPDRVIPVDRKADVPRPEIVLYGTMIDSVHMAFIEDKKNPVTTPGRGNRQRVVRQGEVVSGYTVTGIMKDRIVLARGDDRITVMLSPPDKRKAGDTSSPPAPQPPPVQAKPPHGAPASPARPPQVAPASPNRPNQTIPGTPPGGIKGPPLPVGETARPGALPAGTQPRSVPE
ncbi:MAG: hypothetical protein ABFD62_00985 [Syntrophaceae bacterium]